MFKIVSAYSDLSIDTGRIDDLNRLLAATKKLDKLHFKGDEHSLELIEGGYAVDCYPATECLEPIVEELTKVIKKGVFILYVTILDIFGNDERLKYEISNNQYKLYKEGWVLDKEVKKENTFSLGNLTLVPGKGPIPEGFPVMINSGDLRYLGVELKKAGILYDLYVFRFSDRDGNLAVVDRTTFKKWASKGWPPVIIQDPFEVYLGDPIVERPQQTTYLLFKALEPGSTVLFIYVHEEHVSRAIEAFKKVMKTLYG